MEQQSGTPVILDPNLLVVPAPVRASYRLFPFHLLTGSRPKLASYPKGLVKPIIVLVQGLNGHVRWIWLNKSLLYAIPRHLSRRMTAMGRALDPPFLHTPEARPGLAKEKQAWMLTGTPDPFRMTLSTPLPMTSS